jgi:hypothetical protein
MNPNTQDNNPIQEVTDVASPMTESQANSPASSPSTLPPKRTGDRFPRAGGSGNR